MGNAGFASAVPVASSAVLALISYLVLLLASQRPIISYYYCIHGLARGPT
jgi:hypothetical protein